MKKMFFDVKYSKKERFLIYNTVNSNQYANVINSNIVTVLPWLVKLKFPHTKTYMEMNFKSWISCKEETYYNVISLMIFYITLYDQETCRFEFSLNIWIFWYIEIELHEYMRQYDFLPLMTQKLEIWYTDYHLRYKIKSSIRIILQ